MSRWDDKEAGYRKDIVPSNKLFTHSIALSIGTVFGMALVYFFG